MDIAEIAQILMSFRDNIKVYHWQTYSYARHKASDRLASFLTDKIDEFMEVLQGSENTHVYFNGQSFSFDNHTDESIITLMNSFRLWLINLNNYLTVTSTDLLNIRDEILAKVNQTMYLFSLY